MKNYKKIQEKFAFFDKKIYNWVMQLKQVKISNIMSFPYLQDFDNTDGVIFQSHLGRANLNVLIGSNGSGKSNFIEILNQFIKSLIFDYTFDPSIIKEEKKAEYHQAIQLIEKKTSHIMKHSHSQDLPAYLELTVEMFDTDLEHMKFVCEHLDIINSIIDKYSSLPYRFPKVSFEKIKTDVKTITVHAEFLEKEQEFVVDPHQFNLEDYFALVCFQEQELLYICTRIYNEIEHFGEGEEKKEKIGYPMRHMFSLLSSNRDQIDWKYLHSGRAFDGYVFQKKEDKDQILEGFYKVLYKAWMIIHGSIDKLFTDMDDEELEDLVKEKLLKSHWRQNFTRTIQRFLHKKLVVEIVQGELFLKLQTQHNEYLYFSDLSSGQQSILVILFAIFGADLTNGVMIIDEPELHIHPQLQKELTILLNKISVEKNTQFILSTYSALFINEDNIMNVYRFQKEHREDFDGTNIYNPHLQMASDDAKLVHLLRFENLSKIFFVDKIILVEGDSDLYFFSHYLKRLQEQPERENIIGTYEFININGKGSYKLRNKFLNKFGIENYFIGDRDNTVDYGFFSTKEINKYYALANKRLKGYNGESGDYYNKLVYSIKRYYPNRYRQVLKDIDRLYENNVFILKLGAIESYPGLERKGLQFMVHFANYEFANWLISPKYQVQRDELETIFRHIFKD
ncbi:hypothetical protein AGMMS50249_1790 [candidate division SR1 bacterium]|nr:hypothetical protein AGMMS50249_1790 [candidate division SR1 bacterium]